MVESSSQAQDIGVVGELFLEKGVWISNRKDLFTNFFLRVKGLLWILMSVLDEMMKIDSHPPCWVR